MQGRELRGKELISKRQRILTGHYCDGGTFNYTEAERFVRLCGIGDLESVTIALQKEGDERQEKIGVRRLGSREVSKEQIDEGLLEALKNNCNAVAKVLLKSYNADVNSEGGHGRNALHIAVWANNTEGTKLLLSHPSLTSMNDEDNWGYTPAMWGIVNNQMKCLPLLLDDLRVDLYARLGILLSFVENPNILKI